jgi:hypothetical protein
MARKRRLKAGNLADLQQILWATVLEVERLLDTRPPSNELILRSAHALAQLAGSYTRVVDACDIVARLEALEEASQHGKPQQ